MKRRKLLLLSILSGLLFSVAWPANGFAPLLLIAFVPLFFVERAIAAKDYRNSFGAIFPYAYLTFFIWNLLTTYWVYFSSPFGGVAAITLNSLFVAVIFGLFHITKKRLGTAAGNVALITYWIAFEKLHLSWDLSWPWLSLGNGFSEYYKWIQWYEYTGTFGGALWIFAVNLLVFHVLKNLKSAKENPRRFIKDVIITDMVILIPVIISYVMYFNYQEEENPIEVVAVQPNIDPYYEKFGSMTVDEQMEKLLDLADQKVDENTDFLIGPETALPRGIWENRIELSSDIKRLKTYIEDYPDLSIVIGASTYKMYVDGEKPSSTAREYRGEGDMFYDAYNTAMLMEKDRPIEFYHKSKLVPGVEKMPYPSLFRPLERLAVDLGGISGSLGTQEDRTVFFSDDSIGVAPAVCYESIYGDYTTDYIRKGAQFIFIITNDGWWQNTAGHRQHNSYARLRAIEMRRSIARSANTGISCFVNQRGDMEQETEYWVDGVIKANINANDELTVYAKYGDYIARVSILVASLLLLWKIATAMKNRKKRLS